MTSVWMGHSTLKSEVDAGKIELTGDKAIAGSMNEWLGLEPAGEGVSRQGGVGHSSSPAAQARK